MDVNEIRVVGVVGAGTMGAQIAQQSALFGYDVVLCDLEPLQLSRAIESNRRHLLRRVEKARITAEEMESALARVRTVSTLEEVGANADFVVEAVVERLEVKRDVFSQLDAMTDATVILATNSSTIGVSQIASDLRHPERCINMHFFHPVLVMSLVEVMKGEHTSTEVVDITMEMARRIGKVPVVVQREVYGLIVNRILGAIKREAFWLAENGYASPEDIDRAVKLGLNHPMGPFELADFSGIDVFYHATLQRYRETGDEQYKPSPLLEEKVKAGHLGRKSGRGFYEYPDGTT